MRDDKGQTDFIAGRLLGNDGSSKAMAFLGMVRKTAGVFAAGILIGLFDGLNVLYAHVGSTGAAGITLYQAGFMLASAAAAYLCLSERSWGKLRKLSSFLAAPFIATIADNVSVDVQLKTAYVLRIPRIGSEWRIQDFGHTALGPLARLTDGSIFGILDGYLISIAALVAFIGLQYAWSRRGQAQTAEVSRARDANAGQPRRSTVLADA